MDKPIQEEHFDIGPYSMLLRAVRENEPVIISCRNNRKILGRVKAFDRHLNLILEDACETWTEKPKGGSSKTKPIAKERVFNKLFLRGDSIIFIVKQP